MWRIGPMRPAHRCATLVPPNRSWSVNTVRAATFAASIIAVGVYLAVAAAFAFSPTWVGLGVLAISLVASVSMVLAERPAQPKKSTT